MNSSQSFENIEEAPVQNIPPQPPYIQNPYAQPVYQNYSDFYQKFENPFGAIFIAILNFILGAGALFSGITILILYLTQSAFMQNRAWGFQILTTNPATILLEYGGLALLGTLFILLGIFMLMKKNWARITQIVVSGIGALTSLVLFVMAIANKKIPALLVFLLLFGLSLFMALYLSLSNAVKIAFTQVNAHANNFTYQRVSS